MPAFILILVAVSYLIIAYLLLAQLVFLEKYQLLLDLSKAFNSLVHYSWPLVLLGMFFLFLIFKVLKPLINKEKKPLFSDKTIRLASFGVLAGLAASLLAIFFPMFYVHTLSKPAPWSTEELTRIAIHEAGHAVIREIEFPGSTIKAKIICTSDIANSNNWFSQSLPAGFVMGSKSSRLPTQTDIYKNIRIYLAGLAAKQVIFGEKQTSIGASNDLERVQTLIILLANNGLSSTGPLVWDALNEEERAFIYKDTVNIQYQLVLKMIQEHQGDVMAVANELKNNRNLTGDQIRAIIANQ